MRHTKWFLPMTVVVALGFFGCSKSSPPPPPVTTTTATTETAPGEPVFDASKLKAAFGADDLSVSEVVGFIKDKDYARALKTMQLLAKSPKLKPAQKQAVDETITWLQNASGTN